MRTLKLVVTGVLFLTGYWSMGQDISVAGKYTRSDLSQFQTGQGVEIGLGFYDKFENRISFAIGASYRGKSYEYSIFSDAFGSSIYREVDPDNYMLSFNLSYDWKIFEGAFSAFYLGGGVSISSYWFNENGLQLLPYSSAFSQYTNKTTEALKLGVGLNFEYIQKISKGGPWLFFALQPNIIKYNKFGLDGSSKPGLVQVINYKIGLRFGKLK